MDFLSRYDEKVLHTKATGKFDTITVNVDEEKVDVIVKLLKAKGLKDEGDIIIRPMAVTISSQDKGPSKKKEKIAPTIELVEASKESSRLSKGYVYISAASAFVATLGLLLDSPAAVIGAMVIAPLLGPAISVSVGTVLGDAKLVKNAAINMLVGLAIVIGISTVTAWAAVNSGLITPLLDFDGEIPKEILDRTNLNVLNIGLALASGAAGAYSFAKKKGETLMGVMIAVALVPPACVVGIGVALGNWEVFAGSLLIMLLNLTCITIAGILVLWRMGVRPQYLLKKRESSILVKRRVAATAVVLVLLSSFFVYSTYETYTEYRFKEDIQKEISNITGSFENVTDIEITQIDIVRENVDIDMILYSNCGNVPSNSSSLIKQGLDLRFGNDYDFKVRLIVQIVQES